MGEDSYDPKIHESLYIESTLVINWIIVERYENEKYNMIDTPAFSLI